MNKAKIRDEESAQTNTESEHITEKTWRKEKIWELKAKGYTHREILEELSARDPLLKISLGTITRDLQQKQDEIKANFQRYISEELVTQHQLALTNLKSINKEAWRIFEKATDEKVKLSALSTAQAAQAAINQCLGDPELIMKAMRTAGQLRKQLDITTNEGESSNTGNSAEGEKEELQEQAE